MYTPAHQAVAIFLAGIMGLYERPCIYKDGTRPLDFDKSSDVAYVFKEYKRALRAIFINN